MKFVFYFFSATLICDLQARADPLKFFIKRADTSRARKKIFIQKGPQMPSIGGLFVKKTLIFGVLNTFYGARWRVHARHAREKKFFGTRVHRRPSIPSFNFQSFLSIEKSNGAVINQTSLKLDFALIYIYT